MPDLIGTRRFPQRLKPLASAILLILGSAAQAATIVVTHVADSHVPGGCSLREAIRSANEDLTPPQTSCAAGGPNDIIQIPFATLALTQGELVITAGTSTTLIGTLPQRSEITRAAVAPLSRIIRVTSSTALVVENLTISNGRTPSQSDPAGGILASDLTLINSEVRNNRAGYGGGVYAFSRLTLNRSAVVDNGTFGAGGGAGILFSGSNLTLIDSVVSGNDALGSGGGIHVAAAASMNITGSTIAGNTASWRGGGLFIDVSSAGSQLHIDNSTIHGNIAEGDSGISGGGGILLNRGTLRIRNSTIHRNLCHADSAGSGIHLLGDASNRSLMLSSTLVAGNLRGFSKYEQDIAAANNTIITGSNNVIHHTSATVQVPANTHVCLPQMGSLGSHGGPTPTVPLYDANCGRDAGLANGFSIDQRGPGYPRVVGTAADIGAFEFNDLIFANGFQ